MKSTTDLMTMLQHVSDAVVRLDARARYVSMNHAAEDIFRRQGRDPIMMMGELVWDIFPDVKGTIVESELRRVMEDEATVKFEFFYPADKRFYETEAFPLSPGAILIFRDITQRKTVPAPA
jgi:PAS domain S-box-containing protein